MSNNVKIKFYKAAIIFIYLWFSVSALPSALFAQQDKIDSLNSLLAQNDLSDSVRIQALNKLATVAGRSNTRLGDSLYKLSVTLARRSKNLYGEIRALIGLTRFGQRARNFTASRESLSQALQLAQKNHVPNYIAEAVNDFYQDCFNVSTGDHVQELEYAIYYLKLAEEYKIQALIADACTLIASVFAGVGKYSVAITYHSRALKILEQTEKTL
jgi:tetratricopeptide (TPR) repeat protein